MSRPVRAWSALPTPTSSDRSRIPRPLWRTIPATSMLGYIATDAAIAQPLLQRMVTEAANRSFNCITVDGDTSTNDALMLIATGQAALPEINDASGADFAALQDAVTEVAIYLAQAIVRDGEGATKFITVRVEGGKDEAECKQKIGRASCRERV